MNNAEVVITEPLLQTEATKESIKLDMDQKGLPLSRVSSGSQLSTYHQSHSGNKHHHEQLESPTPHYSPLQSFHHKKKITARSMEVPGKLKNIANQIAEELVEEADIDLTGVDILSLTRMITQYDIAQFDDDEYKSVKDIIPKIISDKNVTHAFSILDIGAIIRQYRLWRRHLPEVEIFYAVKCNPDHMILKTLANLGVGFDVASTGEINMAIETGVQRNKMIYANPCKTEEDISYARSQNVAMMTFDNECELKKISNRHPTAKLVLRITVDDVTTSKMKFGSKFGCPIDDVESLLQFAKFHKLNVIGVSFHVGSGCSEPSSYSNAMKRAREVFDMAKKFDYNLNLLDIGGGFPGTPAERSVFAEMSEQIRNALHEYFGDIPGLRIIAEPGRFFATSALTHAVRITGKKCINIKKQKNVNSGEENDKVTKVYHYYIDSSLYGMFNNIVFDHGDPHFNLLNTYDDGDGEVYPSVIFGHTCDSMDKITEGIELPELACGDYLYVENHGAYTMASASAFNGFAIRKPIYIFTF